MNNDLIKYNIRNLESMIEDYTEVRPDLRELENTSNDFVYSLANIMEEIHDTCYNGDYDPDYDQGYEKGADDAIIANDTAEDMGRSKLVAQMRPYWEQIEDLLDRTTVKFEQGLEIYDSVIALVDDMKRGYEKHEKV